MTTKTTNQRVALFGGTFNPIHNGHVNSLTTVLNRFDFDEIFVVPSYQSPGRARVEGPTPQQRFEMVAHALDGLDSRFHIDDFEIEQGGVSYTIETIRHFERPYREISLIIGVDQFEHFNRWKDFDEILDKVDLIVTSRPNRSLPQSLDDVNEELRSYIVEFDKDQALLASGRVISFVQLKDVDISSTEVRRRIRQDEDLEDTIPKSVEEYIRKRKLYQDVAHKIGDFESFTRYCGQVLLDGKGLRVQAFDVSHLTQPSEYVLIASGTSTRHTINLSEKVVSSVKQTYGVYPQSVEGQQEGRWVVLDYGSLIIHMFYDYTREEYRLEELWKDGHPLELKEADVH